MSTDEEVPALHHLPLEIQTIALAYFEVGRTEGWAAGYAAADADEDARWAHLARLIGNISRGIPYDELCERRGDHTRAEQHRTLMRRRGITGS
ncbi:hypothetical protein [Georgenia muralis]